MTLLKRLLAPVALLALLSLAACGGGGGASGTSTFGSGSGSGGGSGGSGGGTPAASDLVLVLSSSSVPNDGTQTIVATVTALDANRNALANVPVTVSANSGGIVTAGGTVTSAAGVLTATVGIGSDRTNRTITVTARSGDLSRTADLTVRDPISGGGTGPTLDVALSSGVVTAAAPATVTVLVRDNAGAAVRNAVVGLSTLRGNLATLSAASVLTDAAGGASVQLRSAASGVAGADEVIATATVAGVLAQGRAGFQVTADAPTVAFTPTNASVRLSTSPTVFTARVLNAAGGGAANQLVRFSALNGRVTLSATAALTDANGDASVAVTPVNASASGADILTASATVAGRDVQTSASIQIVGEAPSLTSTITSTSISSTAPATLRVVVRDLQGNLLPNAVVSFASAANLATFTPATQLSNASGEATTVISPRQTTTSGADTITASVTVQGITTSTQRVVQFTSLAPTGTPTLDLALSTTSISAASPATVTATLRDAQGNGVPSQVVTFAVLRGLASTNVATALTKTDGSATAVISPASATAAGADEISASVTYAGAALQQTRGFEVQATPVVLGALTAAANPLSAYGQTTLTLNLTGASVTAPVAVTLSSSCVAQGKASLSPASFTATSGTVSIQYRDNGCGAVQSSDQLQAIVTATGASSVLALGIQPPSESSVAFVSAAPEQIFLRGSGFTESSVVTFEVRDAAGNPLPNRDVEFRLLTGAGGVSMEGRGVEAIDSANPFTLTSNASGRVSVRVNSGTLPTPVRVYAKLVRSPNTLPTIATVSSNLSVAVGLPSQLNFSLSQATLNIEGYNIDGTANTYTIIAADRSGNPVPSGTSINFVTEGGQIEAIKQTQLVNGIARTTANFVSSSPRPVDGRITITAYTLGEESFIDQNGNNSYDAGEPFQDLGSVFKDRNFDGAYSSTLDEFISLSVNDASACTAPASNLLLLDASIPSRPATCNTAWSGAGQVYVRRAAETVLSTSSARPLWASVAGLSNTCSTSAVRLQVGPQLTDLRNFIAVAGDTWYANGSSGVLSFTVADANPGRARATFANPLTDYDEFPRLNPMAAGSVVSASTPTTGLTVSVGGGGVVPSTTEASGASVAFNFTDPAVSSGIIFVSFRSPSGTTTTVSVPVSRNSAPSTCTVP